MKILWTVSFVAVSLLHVNAQSLELKRIDETFQSNISNTVKIPIEIRNNGSKAQSFIVRQDQQTLGTTQRGYFCVGDECLEAGIFEVSRTLAPGQSDTELYFVLETGVVPGLFSIHFDVVPQQVGNAVQQYAVAVAVDEGRSKPTIFQSPEITIHDIYPNPTSGAAFVEYRLEKGLIRAKIVLHNVLGGMVGQYALPENDGKVKLPVEELPAGVYFYTVYVDNQSVFTRKLMIRK